jgi:hypothetical protein
VPGTSDKDVKIPRYELGIGLKKFIDAPRASARGKQKGQRFAIDMLAARAQDHNFHETRQRNHE